ncbi:MAG TPA: hypothetical protein VIR16_02550 [Candidatus Limnocylindrales bacterium]
MAEDPLETVLRLVAEGRLTAEEASPILEALDAHGPTPGRPPSASASFPFAGAGPFGSPPPGFGPDVPNPPDAGTAGSSVRSLRIEVREAGRSVVNLRLPLAMGRFAIDRIPGLSSDQVDRVRAALNSGMTGPVFVVDDGGESVRITIE